MNVVSFCLYGSKAMYITGMKENIILAKKHFKDWNVRIYYNDTVDKKYIDEYIKLGAECFKCENVGKNKHNWEGMFWRWYPLDDPNVNCWLSRDADSRLSKREFDMVDQWVRSGKTLHSIRDHRCHFNPIMGGMFGINNKLFHSRYKFKKIKEIINDLTDKYKERPYNVDQIFLNESNDGLWRLLENDNMAHISNQGRKVKDEDIEVPSVPDFIGKQYRLDDFLENKLKILEGKKGCYWKKTGSSYIYWSNDTKKIKKDVIFESEGDYYNHRVSKGYRQDWSEVYTLDGIEVDDTPIKGCYWKEKMKPHVYWSNDENNIKKDVCFTSQNDYFNHRVKNGYSKDWKNIKEIIDKGCYWRLKDSNYINWSNSSIEIKCDITFGSEETYHSHREKNGFKKNWSDILTLTEKELKTKDNLVSVAISTYEANGNGVKLLKYNLEQIDKQSYDNIEIVISDHSKDKNIKNFIDSYSSKYPIRYYHNPIMKGSSSHNTNNAIEKCNGEYIKIMFMDDYLYNKDGIKMIVDEFQKYPDKKWLVHNYEHTKDYKVFYNKHMPKFSHDIIFCNRIGCPSCLTIHRSVDEKFDINLKWFMDSEYYSRLLNKYKEPIFLNTGNIDPIMINVHHNDQVSHICNKEVSDKEKLYINSKIKLKGLHSKLKLKRGKWDDEYEEQLMSLMFINNENKK